jgi:hypothetical protein
MLVVKGEVGYHKEDCTIVNHLYIHTHKVFDHQYGTVETLVQDIHPIREVNDVVKLSTRDGRDNFQILILTRTPSLT